MASSHDFYNTTVGQQVELQRVMASAGFTAEDVARIIKKPDLAFAMYASIRPKPVEKVHIGCGHTMLVDGRHLSASWQAPVWYVCPTCQLARARQLWPDIVLPEPPKEFAPWTMFEVLLLHVPDTFDNLWDLVEAPAGYTKKYRSDSVKSDKWNLRLSPNKREFTEPVWLAFNPEHGKGERPDSFWGQADIAASEVFSALIQFPEWPRAWFNGAPAPKLTGYQLKYDGNWSHVPYLNRWDDDRQLRLSVYWADYRGDYWSSPSVREC